MKKIFFLSGMLAAGIATAMAQSDDVVTLVNRAVSASHEDPVLGTSRYTGMAGAMSALGGDASTMKDNPAGLGVYRRWDLSFAPNIIIDNDGGVGFNVNNFGLVMNFGDTHRTSGYVTSSFGIAYNRQRNFRRNSYETGTFPDADGNTADYENEFTEKGGFGEWNFAYGLNLSNIVYLGLGLNAADLHYTQTTTFNDEVYRWDTDGSGFNIKLGAIIKPVDLLRISLAFQSPTWYDIDEKTKYVRRDGDDYVITDEYGRLDYGYEGYEYDLQTPLKFNGGLGFVIGKRALVGIDYLYQDFTNIRLSNDEKEFRDEKSYINHNLKATHTIKAGAEVQIAKGFAGRVGFAHVTSPTEDGKVTPVFYRNIYNSVALPKEANYFTLGGGYHGKSFYIDLAYMHKNQKEDFYTWISEDDAVKPQSGNVKTNNISATIGFKF